MTDEASAAADLSEDEVAQKIVAIVAEQTMVEHQTVTLASTPEELGIDSLGLVEIVFAIEETFDLSVPFNANEPTASEFDLSSVGAVVTAVKRLIAEQKSA
ncbi:MAG: phosphopantetheine-binding protein [Pseudomonadota bacterium]